MKSIDSFFKNKIDDSTLSILLNIEKASVLLNKKLINGESEIKGATGTKNIQGENVQKLDIIAHNLFIDEFNSNANIHAILSEEKKDIIKARVKGKYLIAMDPLDGSSNIDVNIPVGSIFSIYEKQKEHKNFDEKSFLVEGRKQTFAAYIIYGTSTMFIIGIQNYVYGFTLNLKKGKYFLTHQNITIPENGNIFSINEGNNKSVDDEILAYLNFCKSLNNKGKRTHTGRFIGSLVADFHRNMLKGGIFMYPDTADKPNGQLRLIYECNPIALIASFANGSSSNKSKNILNIKPKENHERTPFFVGSKKMMEKLLSFYQK